MKEQEKEEDEEKEETSKKATKKPPRQGGSVNIAEPMSAWILLLLVALTVQILLSNSAVIPQSSSAYSIATSYSNFVLQFPGIVILPLIVGAIIGAEVGSRSASMQRALRSGLLNGIYAAVIYVITIIVIYVIIGYATPKFVSSVYSIVFNSMAIPIIVMLITIEVFAMLSYSRKVDS